jgi:hypothetical protein
MTIFLAGFNRGTESRELALWLELLFGEVQSVDIIFKKGSLYAFVKMSLANDERKAVNFHTCFFKGSMVTLETVKGKHVRA